MQMINLVSTYFRYRFLKEESMPQNSHRTSRLNKLLRSTSENVFYISDNICLFQNTLFKEVINKHSVQFDVSIKLDSFITRPSAQQIFFSTRNFQSTWFLKKRDNILFLDSCKNSYSVLTQCFPACFFRAKTFKRRRKCGQLQLNLDGDFRKKKHRNLIKLIRKKQEQKLQR